MKAIVQDGYGSAGVLKLRDIARPSIGDGEVLVRVRAAGVDPGVWHLMTGEPYLVRVMGFGLRKPKVSPTRPTRSVTSPRGTPRERSSSPCESSPAQDDVTRPCRSFVRLAAVCGRGVRPAA